MMLNVSVKQLTVLMPLLLLWACGGDRPQPKTAILSPQPSQKAAAMAKPELLWPQSSQLKVFTRFQNASAGKKFFQAYQARQPGQWEQKSTTIEGSPFFLRFYYLGQGTAVYVEYDTRQDQWSGLDRTRQLCDRLIPPKDNQSIFRQEGCHLIGEIKRAGR
jgi:hypothetical protein